LAGRPEYGMAGQMDLLLLNAVSPELVRNWPDINRDSAEPPASDDRGGGGSVPSPGGVGRRNADRGRQRWERDGKPRDRRGAQSRTDRPGVRQPAVGERTGGSGGRHAAPRKLRRRSL
jgi:hypothetical protein